jgi:hypothetical protein
MPHPALPFPSSTHCVGAPLGSRLLPCDPFHGCPGLPPLACGTRSKPAQYAVFSLRHPRPAPDRRTTPSVPGVVVRHLKPGTRGLPKPKRRCHICPRVAQETSIDPLRGCPVRSGKVAPGLWLLYSAKGSISSGIITCPGIFCGCRRLRAWRTPRRG